MATNKQELNHWKPTLSAIFNTKTDNFRLKPEMRGRGLKGWSFLKSVGSISQVWTQKVLIMVLKGPKTDNFRFWPEMRGRSRNPIPLSSSTPSVTPIKLFRPKFYHKVWPLSLFSGLLPVFESFPVDQKESYVYVAILYRPSND